MPGVRQREIMRRQAQRRGRDHHREADGDDDGRRVRLPVQSHCRVASAAT